MVNHFYSIGVGSNLFFVDRPSYLAGSDFAVQMCLDLLDEALGAQGQSFVVTLADRIKLHVGHWYFKQPSIGCASACLIHAEP